MKAKITQKSELDLNLQQSFTFDIYKDDEVVLSSQVLRCSPSALEQEMRNKLTSFEEEYELSQQIEEGTEIS